ncbi:MAG TPA: flagellar hook capping FlgD N-terminal domain-containing protein [Bryobacteraceae bacterium]|jgi:flagellar basal-body rod modification protein FlgD|nr:flagellar hook capping FlgD N-terminal domain-containing protein [Bryobacteraceae bacterium]
MSSSTLPISSIAALTPTTTAPSSAAVTNLASQGVFLQLLVAQLKNQDPEQPTDGTAFVTELAQFTTLQEDTQSATDLNTIVASLPSPSPTTPTTPTTTPTTSNQ